MGSEIINICIQQGCIKLIKSDSKYMNNVTKDYNTSNNCGSCELSNHRRKKNKFVSQFSQKDYVFNIDKNENVSWAVNQYIRLISEGSCDTEDWSNDAENSAAHHRNQLHFNIYLKKKPVIWNFNNISYYCCFYCIFYPINAALVSRRVFKTISRNLTNTKPLSHRVWLPKVTHTNLLCVIFINYRPF